MKRWWHRFFRLPGELRALGVVGLNQRNAELVLPNNPRRNYDRVDNKIFTKRLAVERGISVPETYGVVRSPADVRRLGAILGERDSFVIKPARGSGGKGVLVICGRDEGHFLKGSGARLTLAEIKEHIQNIIAGLFSLGGKRDVALVEARIEASRQLTGLSFQGAPDIRVVMLHGYPVMAMLRASTRQSDGRSNLHQGALGIGIDIASGRTVHAVYHGRPVTRHPDLKVPVVGVTVPNWSEILEISVICHEMSGLGYLGVDLMIDERAGPVMIEVNARPGLAIQLANGVGLRKRVGPVLRRLREHPCDEPAEKIAFARKTFAVAPPSAV